MQNAPSVVYPVGRSSCMGWMFVALGVAILLTALLAGFTMNRSSTAWFALLVPWLAWCGWAWRQWRRAPGGWLHWQAQGHVGTGASTGVWRWQTDRADAGAELRSVEPVLDLQTGWLLRLEGAHDVPRWVCVESARDPASWLAMRRALTAVSRAR